MLMTVGAWERLRPSTWLPGTPHTTGRLPGVKWENTSGVGPVPAPQGDVGKPPRLVVEYLPLTRDCRNFGSARVSYVQDA
jgi:hypothetical protein